MKTQITEEQAIVYRKLAVQARRAQDEIDLLVLHVSQANVPDGAKLNIMDWIERVSAFRGLACLAYFLTPQSEWTGGDSFVTNEPHICNTNL